MGLHIPDEGASAILTVMAAALGGGSIYARLHQNNFSPGEGSVIGSFTEADFSGYSPIVLSPRLDGESNPLPLLINARRLQWHDLLWTHDGGGTANTVYGVYFTDPGNTVVFWSSLLGSPVTLSSNGQTAGYTPTIGMGMSSLLTDLVAYWTLDEVSGTRSDSTTNDQDLTDHNTVGSTTGVISDCASFVGANGEKLTATLPTAFTDTWSVSFWGRLDDHTTLNGFISNLNGNTDFSIETHGPGALFCSLDNFVTYRAWLCADDENFHHYCLVFDGSQTGNANRLKLYYDGTLLTAVADVGTISSTLSSGSDDLTLGLSRFWLTGSLDEVGIWSRPLSSGEVTSLYNSGSGLAYPFS